MTSTDRERARDVQRLDKVIDTIVAELDPEHGPDMNGLAVGARALVMLLERRAALLGLDAQAGEKPAQNATDGPVARILAAVPK